MGIVRLRRTDQPLAVMRQASLSLQHFRWIRCDDGKLQQIQRRSYITENADVSQPALTSTPLTSPGVHAHRTSTDVVASLTDQVDMSVGRCGDAVEGLVGLSARGVARDGIINARERSGAGDGLTRPRARSGANDALTRPRKRSGAGDALTRPRGRVVEGRLC